MKARGLTHVTDDGEMEAVSDAEGLLWPEETRSLFVRAEGGRYTEVWGCESKEPIDMAPVWAIHEAKV
jgi:hypothetical protein